MLPEIFAINNSNEQFTSSYCLFANLNLCKHVVWSCSWFYYLLPKLHHWLTFQLFQDGFFNFWNWLFTSIKQSWILALALLVDCSSMYNYCSSLVEIVVCFYNIVFFLFFCSSSSYSSTSSCGNGAFVKLLQWRSLLLCRVNEVFFFIFHVHVHAPLS